MALNERVAALDINDLIASLQSRAHDYYCGVYISYLTGMERTQLYQELETERVESKYHDLKSQYEFVGKDWNQTMFVMMMRYISDKYNKKNYVEIAYRIGYSTLCHERDSIENIEALLLATSGLLGTLPIDTLTDPIRKRGAHLLRKYQITPLLFDQWNHKEKFAGRTPITRLLQMAQLLFQHEFLFNDVLNCRSRRDIFSLFSVSVRDVWMPYLTTGVGGKRVSQLSIGVDKIDLFGINVVIPLFFTFGHFSSNDELIDIASDLNETIPAESNYIISGWRERGLNPLVAYDSQALIQLGSVYCLQGEEHKKRRKRGEEILSRCEECPVFKHLCSRASAIERVPAFLEF